MTSGELFFFTSLSGIFAWFIWRSLQDARTEHDKLARAAVAEDGGLHAVARGVFDEPPIGRLASPCTACLEGRRGGETLSVRAEYLTAARRRELGIGIMKLTPVTAMMGVAVNLRGATCELDLRAQPNAAIEDRLEAGFEIAGDRTLLDKATKALVVGAFARGLPVRRIYIDREGLHIEWLGTGGVPALHRSLSVDERRAGEDADRVAIEVAADLAAAFQRRILEVLEQRGIEGLRRAAGYRDLQVRVDTAYDPPPRPESEEGEEEEEEEGADVREGRRRIDRS